MMEWLENGEDQPSNLDVWGIEKSSYIFKDLKCYLEEAKEKGKGKGKKKIGGGEKKSHKKAKKQVK